MKRNSPGDRATDAHAPSRLNPRVTAETIFLDRTECRELGDALHATYVDNKPFPHIAIDHFLPNDLLRRVVAEFPQRQEGRFNDETSRLKTGYQVEKIESPFITNLIDALNSAPFLDFLERMTGIQGLITDPHQLGGGLHETARGGHLSIHADFNYHPHLQARRRMNLILFLNEDWQDKYGGALELWEKDMSGKARAIMPVMGRVVVFNTEDDSFHGHPDPLECPDGVYRRSLALYYYTVPDETHSNERKRSTDFRARPGSDDRVSRGLKIRALARDCVPPILYRAFRRK